MLNVYLEIGGLYTFPLSKRVYERKEDKNDLSAWKMILGYIEAEEPFVILEYFEGGDGWADSKVLTTKGEIGYIRFKERLLKKV